MHFYSIFVATIALMVSTASANEAHWEKAAADCLNICQEESTGFTCPPDTEKAQLPNGCWTCCDSA
ncbi:unnamed protein product [Penicillium viridicatum]